MARGINKVILIGNLGQDPETRAMPQGGAVANLRIATTDSWRDKQTGENKESTEWHTVVVFGRTAEVAAQYLRKGSQVYIEGRLRTRKWQDKATGADRYSTEIVANEMQMLSGPKGAGNESRDSRDNSAGGEPSWGGESRGGGGGGGGSTAPASAPGHPFDDDDIPF